VKILKKTSRLLTNGKSVLLCMCLNGHILSARVRYEREYPFKFAQKQIWWEVTGRWGSAPVRNANIMARPLSIHANAITSLSAGRGT